MKKKILGGALVLAIAAVAAFNVNLSSQNSDMSSLTLANVEALAGGEYDQPIWRVEPSPSQSNVYFCFHGGCEKC
ncbi:MAG: NVEALA domain-containing protein [Prevotella sp.]|jgi:uncharacterized protein YraI|nr:NVEALA domain-containing protein [Prevotella sp.]